MTLVKLLLGAHRTWSGQVIARDMQDRFATALGIAGARPAETRIAADTLVAATANMRGWRPQLAPDGCHVLFAGHIDNRRQLARDLNAGNATDAELYARGIAAWGDAIDLRAIGQFAAIIIRPGGQAIRLSRSPIAAPPLHYWHDRTRFIVASLGSAIFSTGEVEQRIDQQKIADSLFLNYNEGARSWFEGVSRLACGHRATATRDGVVVERYYDPAAIPKIRFKDDRDYLAAASELFEEGVRAALDGFSRPAVSLSGGFDSQAVAAFVARCRPGQPIDTFTSVPEAGWDEVINPRAFGNERPYVEALAAMHPEIRPHWIDAAGLYFEHKLRSMFMLYGGPPRNASNLHWIHETYARARASGCDVMLNGSFGNVTFSFDGHGALAAMAQRGQWLRLWQEAGLLRGPQARSRLRIIASSAVLPFAPDWLHTTLARSGLIKKDDPFATWCPLDRDYARRFNVAQRAQSVGFDPRFRTARSSRKWRDDMLTLPGQDIADLSQAFELIHGIETRDPTSYRPLVEFCLGIPDDQYVRNGTTRLLARRMLKGLVPDMVLDETRIGMQSADWQLRLGRQRGELLAEIDQLGKDVSMAAMLDLDAMRQALIDLPEKAVGPAASRLSLALPRALVTARFIRFVEGRNE